MAFFFGGEKKKKLFFFGSAPDFPSDLIDKEVSGTELLFCWNNGLHVTSYLREADRPMRGITFVTGLFPVGALLVFLLKYNRHLAG